jgi:hypothetical protein
MKSRSPLNLKPLVPNGREELAEAAVLSVDAVPEAVAEPRRLEAASPPVEDLSAMMGITQLPSQVLEAWLALALPPLTPEAWALELELAWRDLTPLHSTAELRMSPAISATRNCFIVVIIIFFFSFVCLVGFLVACLLRNGRRGSAELWKASSSSSSLSLSCDKASVKFKRAEKLGLAFESSTVRGQYTGSSTLLFSRGHQCLCVCCSSLCLLLLLDYK